MKKSTKAWLLAVTTVVTVFLPFVNSHDSSHKDGTESKPLVPVSEMSSFDIVEALQVGIACV